MKVFNLSDELPVFRDAAVTVGSYDGVHFGHRVLLDRLKEKAAETGGESVVATFYPHPRQVLSRGGDLRLLSTLQEKRYLLGEAGVDNLVILPFDKGFASMPPEAFVRDILCRKLGMKWLVVGYDHHFGRGQEGDFDMLKRLGAELGFGADRISERELDGGKVSSSAVRRAIADGDMKKAGELLSRPYIVMGDIHEGVVIPGDPSKLMPPAGDYAVTVGNGETKEKTVLHIDSEGAAHIGAPDLQNVLVEFE